MTSHPINEDDENLWDDPLVKATDEVFDHPNAGRRFMGFFADVVAAAIAYYMLLFAIFYLYKQSGSVPTWLFEGGFSNLVPVGIYLVMVGGMEALAGGQSIGKLVSGTVVVKTDGSAPEGWHILVRTLCRLLPGEALMILFDAKKRTAHDALSGTKVIRKNPFNG